MENGDRRTVFGVSVSSKSYVYWAVPTPAVLRTLLSLRLCCRLLNVCGGVAKAISWRESVCVCGVLEGKCCHVFALLCMLQRHLEKIFHIQLWISDMSFFIGVQFLLRILKLYPNFNLFRNRTNTWHSNRRIRTAGTYRIPSSVWTNNLLWRLITQFNYIFEFV